MSSREFDQALSDFTLEAACGGAVRHLADLGYSLSEIRERLDYPVSAERTAGMVWKYYTDTGHILLCDPEEWEGPERITYVKETGAYGRTSFIRKAEKCARPDGEYVKCDFGRLKRKNSVAFTEAVDRLEEGDREYIMLLPWPLTPVWHLADERIKRIMGNGSFE